MKAGRLCLALLWVAAACAQPAAEPRDQSREIFNEIDHILERLAEISGLRLHHRVACDLISREKVNAFLKKRVKEAVSPAEIRGEELTLKKFGLVPADFDLAKSTIDLLTEQAAAFYDFNKKKLFITDWTPSATRQAVLVHELAHALADQNFNLSRFIRQGRQSDDAATAHMAVLEGQASWLMAEYLARQMGQTLKNSPALLDMMSRAGDSGGQYPVFEGAPLYLQETLIFPYTKGMLFQQALYLKLERQAFGGVFRRAPVSTQQILHPEHYFAGVAPEAVTLPPLGSPRGMKRFTEGTLGELDHAILIQQFAGKEKADALAPHWKGGQYALFENRGRDRIVLAYAAKWDDAASAADYFQVYREALRKKWKKFSVTSASDREITGVGDDGHFTLRLNGSVLTSVEGELN